MTKGSDGSFQNGNVTVTYLIGPVRVKTYLIQMLAYFGGVYIFWHRKSLVLGGGGLRIFGIPLPPLDVFDSFAVHPFFKYAFVRVFLL